MKPSEEIVAREWPYRKDIPELLKESYPDSFNGFVPLIEEYPVQNIYEITDGGRHQTRLAHRARSVQTPSR